MDSWIQNSSIVCKKASVCSDQPQATSIGIDILKKGGNAADAAVATMAAVSVIQPMSCGIGGDCHCLFFRNSNKTVLAVNGSGRTGKNASLEELCAVGITDPRKCPNHGLWVSVPGTVAGMFEVVKNFGSGKVTMKEILSPAIRLAEEGTPLPYKHAFMWEHYKNVFEKSSNAQDLLVEGTAPKPGAIIKAPKLARCFKSISEAGPEGFYFGDTAKHIVKAVQDANGVLTLDDLKDHLLDPPSINPSEAVSVDFHGFRIWEMKPNTMGIVALLVFNTLKEYDLKALGHNSAEYIHLLSEATKHAYLECWESLCDPKCCSTPLKNLLTEETANKIRSKIDPERASRRNLPLSGGNTSYVAAVDEEGNGCSFICSVSSNFGTGIVPDECGFVMHDRAKSMSLDKTSSNAFGPKKLPLHSIIPSLVTDSNTHELMAVLGMVGRWMQPQGHVQVLLNMIVFGMDPQLALNQPRFFVGDPRPFVSYKDSLQRLCLEGGIDTNVLSYLESKNHSCKFFSGIKREIFGKGHVIARSKVFNNDPASNPEVWWAGADPRTDGYAMGY